MLDIYKASAGAGKTFALTLEYQDDFCFSC